MTRETHHSFEDYLYLQRVSPRTRATYLRTVSALSAFHRQQPAAELSNEQIQDYLLYCIQEKKLAWASCNVVLCSLKKYYQDYLGRNESEFTIPRRPRSNQLPKILSQQDVRAILTALSNLKHRALLHIVYGSGLRVSEVVKLRPGHIDSSRMLIRVEEAKGRKDRYTILSKTGLEVLRSYWRAYRPEEWLFPGQDTRSHLSITAAQRVYKQAADRAGVAGGRGIHTLRHCFATHACDQGVEIFVIRKWLGHSRLETTSKYLHLSPERARTLSSPLDNLFTEGET